MKIIKLVLGTVFGLATVVYLIEFIRVLGKASFSTWGLTDVILSFVALAIGTLFTIWTFQSALGKRAPKEEPPNVDLHISQAPGSAVSYLLVALVPLTFWIPLIGPIVSWLAIRQARWITLPDWVSFLLVLLFFVAIAVTITCALVLAMDLLGRR